MTSGKKIFVNPEPLKLPQRTTWNHWQLRDVIRCSEDGGTLFSIYRNNVDKYNISTKRSTRILRDLPFEPVSLTVKYGYVVAGGQRGEIVVSELDNLYAEKFSQVGGSINNSVIFSAGSPSIFSGYDDHDHYAQNQDTCLLACNNDQTIKVLSFPSLDVRSEIKFNTSINNASISKDNSKMVVVGDTNEVFLLNKRGNDFEKIATLIGSKDASFSCDWNQFSNAFAVGSQDGYVNVWDIRSTKKMCSIETFQSNDDDHYFIQRGRSRGACRNVKFNPSRSLDILAFSEHTSYVNIVDARTFNKRQVLKISGEGTKVQITGLEFSPSSDKIFVGLESCILDYQVNSLGRRSFPYICPL